VNAYEVKSGIWCNLQVKLRDPCLSAFSVRYTTTKGYIGLNTLTSPPLGVISNDFERLIFNDAEHHAVSATAELLTVLY